jgi:hypothetical protein
MSTVKPNRSGGVKKTVICPDGIARTFKYDTAKMLLHTLLNKEQGLLPPNELKRPLKVKFHGYGYDFRYESIYAIREELGVDMAKEVPNRERWHLNTNNMNRDAIEARYGIKICDKLMKEVVQPMIDAVNAVRPDKAHTLTRDGGGAKPKRKRGRPTKLEAAAYAEAEKLRVAQDYHNMTALSQSGSSALQKKSDVALQGYMPMMPEQFRRKAQSIAPKGLDRLEEIILNPLSKPGDLIAATKEVNDRAYGKPAQSVDVIYQGMTNAELELRRQELVERIGTNRTGNAEPGADCIEGQFREDTGCDRLPDEQAAD